MSRRSRLALLALVFATVLSTAACSDVTAPRGDDPCQGQGSGTVPCP